MSEELREELVELGLQRCVSAVLDAGYNDWELIEDSKSFTRNALLLLYEF